MKMVAGFISGFVICGLLVLGAMTILPTQADEDPSGNATENITNSLVTLLPDIETIYKESLTTPFIKAEEKIYDEDIAEFYADLLDRTGLRSAE
jgi:hypothetical protein